MANYTCEYCGKVFKRSGKRGARFCSLECKGNWQREQKPVTKEWLHQKYVIEGLSTYQIAKLVDRDPKRVYEWLKDYEISIRARAWDTEAQDLPQQNKEWLYTEYVTHQRSALDIANELGVTESNVLYFLKKHEIERRVMSEIRAKKKWGLKGSTNGMFGRTGARNPRWLGGISPERQALYSSQEWAKAVQIVWQRDKATCQRCFRKKSDEVEMNIHHLVGFANKSLRAEPSNLVLLCKDCHHWVHSKQNINKDFIL